MMLRIVQLGFGGVGQALVGQFLELASRYPWLRYAGLADRSGWWLMPGGWPEEELRAALETKRRGDTLMEFARQREGQARFVPVPASASGLPDLGAVFAGGGLAREIVVVDVTAERAAYDT